MPKCNPNVPRWRLGSYSRKHSLFVAKITLTEGKWQKAIAKCWLRQCTPLDAKYSLRFHLIKLNALAIAIAEIAIADAVATYELISYDDAIDATRHDVDAAAISKSGQ